MRYMTLLRADEASEAGLPPDPALMLKMGQFMEEVVKAGVLLATEGLHPSSKGVRLRLADGKRTIIDGPFTESKELIASYAMLQVASKEEAIEWCFRFLDVLGQGECEIRQVFELADFTADQWPDEERAKEEALREEMAANAAKV
jgi:hypothetical protein